MVDFIFFFYLHPPFRAEATFGTGSVTIFLEKIHQSFEPLECCTVKVGWGRIKNGMSLNAITIISIQAFLYLINRDYFFREAQHH